MLSRAVLLLLVSAALPPPTLAGPRAQEAAVSTSGDTLSSEEGWGGQRVRALVRSVAEARRRHPFGDTSLHAFRARAEGHVYFLFDPPGAGEDGRTVARADQLALEVAWRVGGSATQRTVGRRSERRLPTRIRYHDDHLRLLLESFGRRIALGEGTEVRDVPHPVAPGATEHYRYRLADSVEIRLGGERRRLYRVQVRPRDPARPGVIGEMYLDRDRPALARLSVTFTPSSYLDPQLDGVSVDLRSALVHGRYWLPAVQETLVRRELRWLDIPAGGTIRTRFRVFDYEINPPGGVDLTADVRRAAPSDTPVAGFRAWRSGLYAGLPGGVGVLEPSDDAVERVRDRARRIAVRRRLSGILPLRLHVPDVSHALRVRRGEGLLLGAGARYGDRGRSARAWAGFPFGTGRPEVEAAAGAAGNGDRRLELRACFRCLTDMGDFPAAAGALSTLSAVLSGRDWTDPYYRTGVGAALSLPAGGGRGELSLAYERHDRADTARGILPRGARPLRPAEEGSGPLLRGRWRAVMGGALGNRWRVELRGEAAPGPAGGDFGYVRGLAGVRSHPPEAAHPGFEWRGEAWTGLGTGRVPPQRLFLLGGRGTLPGHPFRRWGGSQVLFGRAGASADVLHPWLRARVRLAAGWTAPGESGLGGARELGVEGTGGLRASAAAGAGLFYDLIRVEVARGLGRDGRWEVLLSVDPAFHGVL